MCFPWCRSCYSVVYLLWAPSCFAKHGALPWDYSGPPCCVLHLLSTESGFITRPCYIPTSRHQADVWFATLTTAFFYSKIPTCNTQIMMYFDGHIFTADRWNWRMMMEQRYYRVPCLCSTTVNYISPSSPTSFIAFWREQEPDFY